MTAEVSPMLQPDRVAMREQLEHLFGGFLDGCHDGRIELAWSAAEAGEDGRYALRFGETFGTDEFDALIEKAVEVNSRPRTNVYIGAALRKPGCPPMGRSRDDDFYVAPAYWDDLDDKDANDRARQTFAAAPPSLVVRTGEFPHWRHQLWWRLTDPIADPERVRAAVSGISVATGGDGSVSNPSRLMRLAGSIAWDQKPGRRPELTKIIKLSVPGLDAYQAEHVERVYPPLFTLANVRAARAAPGPNTGVIRGKSSLGLDTGKVIDGRERHMTNVICARLIDYCGQFGASPTVEELFEHAWAAYEQSTDLTRPGRNRPEFMEKCRSTMRRFETGRIRGAENLDNAIASYRVRRDARQQNVRHEAVERGAEGEFTQAVDAYEFLSIAGIKAMPDARWVVRDTIPEDGLGFIYGPPGHGKTFVALNLALSVAYGAMEWWWGKKVDRRGLVVYVAREGLAGLKHRIEAWQRQHGVEHDNAAFVLVRAGINFMNEADIGRLLRTIEAAAAALNAEPTLVFVDTVSRVMPGADENLQKEMTLFVAACDALRDRFKATVVGVHHAGKSGDMRGSTVLKGAGDFVFKVERLEEDNPKSSIGFFAEKVKDAEDGWTKYLGLKPIEWVVDGVIDGERKSLVALPIEEGSARAAKKESGWPDTETCKRILRAIGDAWRDSQPWSSYPQTKQQGRYAPSIISRQFNIPQKVAEEMIGTWLDPNSRLLAVESVNSDTKMKGLKVVGSID